MVRQVRYALECWNGCSAFFLSLGAWSREGPCAEVTSTVPGQRNAAHIGVATDEALRTAARSHVSIVDVLPMSR
jgi:hypothetical protein